MEACTINKFNKQMSMFQYKSRRNISKREQIKIISEMLDKLSFLPDQSMDVNDLELSINIKASGYIDRTSLIEDIKKALNLNDNPFYKLYVTKSQIYIRKQ